MQIKGYIVLCSTDEPHLLAFIKPLLSCCHFPRCRSQVPQAGDKVYYDTLYVPHAMYVVCSILLIFVYSVFQIFSESILLHNCKG